MDTTAHIHPHRADMLSVEQALEQILALVTEMEPQETPLLEADGLTLAEDVYAPFDIPALPNSAMDGYAVRAASLTGAAAGRPVTVEVIGQVRAGELPGAPVVPGAAVRIMTGAPMPDGADCVVPFEFTDEARRLASGQGLSHVAVYHQPSPGDYVRPAGEDLLRGSLVLRRGDSLTPPSVGVLASLGKASVQVVRRPVVAILATGDEVQTPGEALQQGRLFDVNSYAVAAAVRRYGGVPWLLGIARDDMASLRSRLRQGLEADMLVTSAGVSAGAFDMVKDALAELGSISFWAVRMRPSRPLAFGSLHGPDGRMVPHLGLPGNPVSALVAMVEFGRPALAKMLGRAPEPLPTVVAKLEQPVVNTDGRRVFARVTLEDRGGILYARPTGPQGSNLITSMGLAQGLAICPEEISELSAGQAVAVQVFDWLGPARFLSLIRPEERGK